MFYKAVDFDMVYNFAEYALALLFLRFSVSRTFLHSVAVSISLSLCVFDTKSPASLTKSIDSDSPYLCLSSKPSRL